MSLRVLHNGAGSPLGGLLHAVRLILSDAVKSISHIAGSTCDVISQVSSVKVDSLDRLITADIDNFFMSPTHAQLCLSLEKAALAFLIPAVKFLLQEQRVTFKGVTYRALKGSGRGSQISSDLCDLAYFHLCESQFYISEFAV